MESHLTLVKICRYRLHCDEHVWSSSSSTSSSSFSWWSLPLDSPQETLLWLVYEQLEVPLVFIQQIALEIKGWQRG